MDVRNGQKVWPTCPACGCRLDKGYSGYHHFGYFMHSGRDAAGCKCTLLNVRFTKMNNSWYYINATETLNWQRVT